MLFRKEHIPLIKNGSKTMTRRTSKYRHKVGKTYEVKRNWFRGAGIYITIIRRFEERLGDISLEDARKEGYRTIDEFKAIWREIHGKWQPNLVVTVYEFQLTEPPKKSRTLNGWRLI